MHWSWWETINYRSWLHLFLLLTKTRSLPFCHDTTLSNAIWPVSTWWAHILCLSVLFCFSLPNSHNYGLFLQNFPNLLYLIVFLNFFKKILALVFKWQADSWLSQSSSYWWQLPCKSAALHDAEPTIVIDGSNRLGPGPCISKWRVFWLCQNNIPGSCLGNIRSRQKVCQVDGRTRKIPTSTKKATRGLASYESIKMMLYDKTKCK